MKAFRELGHRPPRFAAGSKGPPPRTALLATALCPPVGVTAPSGVLVSSTWDRVIGTDAGRVRVPLKATRDGAEAATAVGVAAKRPESVSP